MTMFIIEEKYGNDGYAFWFKLLEMLGVSNGHYIDCNKPATWEFLQAKTKIASDKCSEILDTLAKLDAIDKNLWEDKIIWSDNFIEGISIVYKHRSTDIPSKPTAEIVLNPQKSTEIGENSLTNDNCVGNRRKSAEIGENPQKSPTKDRGSNSSTKDNNVDYSRVEERIKTEIGENPQKSAEINRNNKKKEFSPFVLLTQDEYNKLIERFGETKTKDKIENLSLYKQSKGKKYASDYATILNWDRKDEKDKNVVVMPRKRFEPGVPDDYDDQVDKHMSKIKERQDNA